MQLSYNLDLDSVTESRMQTTMPVSSAINDLTFNAAFDRKIVKQDQQLLK